MNNIKTKLDYVAGNTVIPEGAFGISPSQLYTFFDRPSQWYREQVLNEDAEFQGSTSSYLGSITHYIAEQFAQTGSVDKSEIYKYLYRDLVSDKSEPLVDFDDDEIAEFYLYEKADHPDIDCIHIISQFKIMGNALIQYLRQNMPNRTEELIHAAIAPGYYACGSADAVTGDVLIDYKTTSALSAPAKIPYNYKLQLLEYAWIYRQLGISINRIRIVWITQNQTGRISEKTGKPMQDYPTTVTPITEMINEDDYDFIESLLNLTAETVQAARDNPHLKHLLFKDMRLKEQ